MWRDLEPGLELCLAALSLVMPGRNFRILSQFHYGKLVSLTFLTWLGYYLKINKNLEILLSNVTSVRKLFIRWYFIRTYLGSCFTVIKFNLHLFWSGLCFLNRNPSLKQQLFSYAILGFALSEAMGLFCLMVAFLILFAM